MKTIKSIIILFAVFFAVLFSGCGIIGSATLISFDGQKIEVSKSNNISVENNILIISDGGTYQFSGEAKDVQILIRSIEPVYIILNDFKIKNENLIPLNIITNCATTIESSGIVTNKITCKGEDENPCIKSKGTVEFKGETNLELQGYKGAAADISINIDARLEIAAEGDALKAETVNISGGSVDISSDKDGIQGDYINIDDGSVNITGASEKSRGIYSKEIINISGGSITVSAADDAICSNNSIYINGGNIIVFSNDDAIHSDSCIEINEGVISIKGCLEGIESGRIEINGGQVNITSANDGLNAAFADKDSKENADITINGGNIYIDADGDGLDANGSIYVNGGVLLVSGAYGGNNNAIDFDDKFVVNGGLIAAVGNKLNAKQAETESSQCVLMISFVNTQQEGREFILTDEEGSALISAMFPKPYGCIIVSSDMLALHDMYYYGSELIEEGKYEFSVSDTGGQQDISNFKEAIINTQSTWIFSGN